MSETRRRLFDQGHKRKFLVIVDESPEMETALAYAVRRSQRTGGGLVLLYIIEPPETTHWLGVEAAFRDEAKAKAMAVFRLSTRKIHNWGFTDVTPEEHIREGKRADEIMKLIEEDRDIGILVLGASVDTAGPGPLVASLAGAKAGTFPIPITVVPGKLSLDDIAGLA
ncbi:MAG: universal stress protein [Hyphomicrobiales bacterium]|nr:universal stress protein [Hyphomicrobiales bacterium]